MNVFVKMCIGNFKKSLNWKDIMKQKNEQNYVVRTQTFLNTYMYLACTYMNISFM